MMPDTRPQLTNSLMLAAVPTAAGIARSFARRCLSQWGLSQLIDATELVMSELVTNAVNATGNTNPAPRWSDLYGLGLISVRLVVTADSLVIEVWDRAPRPPVLREAAEVDEAGRGLVIVEALCRRWGYFIPESDGKTVWGELAITALSLPPSGLPRREQPRLTWTNRSKTTPNYRTLERVTQGLRKL